MACRRVLRDTPDRSQRALSLSRRVPVGVVPRNRYPPSAWKWLLWIFSVALLGGMAGPGPDQPPGGPPGQAAAHARTSGTSATLVRGGPGGGPFGVGGPGGAVQWKQRGVPAGGRPPSGNHVLSNSVPFIAIAVRCPLDANLSGWLCLLSVTTCPGGLVVLVFVSCRPSRDTSSRPNQWLLGRS